MQSKKQLDDFIFNEFINFFDSNGWSNTKELVFGDIAESDNAYQIWKLPISLFDWIWNSLLENVERNKKKRLLIHSSHHADLIKSMKRWVDVIIFAGGLGDRIFAIKNGLRYIPSNKYNELLHYYIREGRKREEHLEEAIDSLRKELEEKDITAILIRRDHLPIDRLICLSAKRKGIPTIVIQHGIYASNAKPLEGKTADYILVWGDFFREWYKERTGKKDSEIFVLGYPYEIRNVGRTKEARKVCYFGQPFEKYFSDILEAKISMLKELAHWMGNAGIELFYRARPNSEDMDAICRAIPEMVLTPKNETLTQALGKYDVFVSFSSTALVDARLHSKLCIQLKNLPINADRMEQFGLCKTVDSNEELVEFLRRLRDDPKEIETELSRDFSDYIFVPDDAGARFLGFWDAISMKH